MPTHYALLLFFASTFFILGVLGKFARSFPVLRLAVSFSRGLKTQYGKGSLESHFTRLRNVLWEMDETLASGLIPRPETYADLQRLPKKLADFSAAPIFELRESGGELRPTLQRIRVFSEKSLEIAQLARTKTLSAFSQSVLCALMIPIFGFVYTWLLPGIQNYLSTWFLACVIAAASALCGIFWIYRLSQNARYGGLAPSRRDWIFAVQSMGERLIAKVRQGTPPDLAWDALIRELPPSCMELSRSWTFQWGPQKSPNHELTETILRFGTKMHEAIALITLEGRPALDRISGIVDHLHVQMDLAIRRDLERLPVRSMKPLFLLVCPAVLGIAFLGLFFGIWAESAAWI